MFGFSVLERHKMVKLWQVIIILFVLQTGRKTLRLLALPVVTMPNKACETCKTNERKETKRAPIDGQNEKKKKNLKSFNELMTRVAKLILD